VDVPTICRRLGHDPARLEPRKPSDAWELQDGADGWHDVMTFIDAGPGRVLLVEENGFGGSDPRALTLLSRPNALAVSAYWNVNWSNRFSVASDGSLVGAVEFTQLEDDEVPPTLRADRDLIVGVAGTDPAGWKLG